MKPTGCCDAEADATVQQIAEAWNVASQFMYTATCKRFSVCQNILRPCYCGCQPCKCSCAKIWMFHEERVHDVKVWIDGGVVNGVKFDERNNTVIFPPSFPIYPKQNLELDHTQVGTWAIEYKYGNEPPADVLNATDMIACNILKRCLDRPCDFGDDVKTVAQNGVIREFHVPGMKSTGIRWVDNIIEQYKCQKKRSYIYGGEGLIHSVD